MGRSNASGPRVPETKFVNPERLDGDMQENHFRPKSLFGWDIIAYFFLGVLALTLVGVWISTNGGVVWGNADFPNLMFHYHPLFMILGLVFITGNTNILYRLFPNGNSIALRWSHGLLQLTAYILMVVAVYAVGFYKDHNTLNPKVSPKHFISVHSWVGLTVLIVMLLQWLCGFFGLLLPGCQGERRAGYRNTHIFTGNLIFFLGCANVLIGIDQLRPSATMNTLALVVLTFAILGGYLLASKKLEPQNANEQANPDERAPLTSPDTYN